MFSVVSHDVDLRSYDRVVINTSGGKDSSVAAWYVTALADALSVKERVVAVHATFPEEWDGTVELALAQCHQLGIPLKIVSRGEALLDYVLRRGRWPSSQQRYCTSEFKRAPIDRAITRLASHPFRQLRVLNVLGIRRDESPARSRKAPFQRDARRTNGRRVVDQWFPVFELTATQVWEVIHRHNIPTHPAYAAGMPRLSCRFCIFAPRPALIRAGQLNPELLRQYAKVEDAIGHSFRTDVSMREILEAVERGDTPGEIRSWEM